MGVTVNFVNVDQDTALTQKYSVTSVPTVMIIGTDGSEWFRRSGAMSAQQLKDVFSRFR